MKKTKEPVVLTANGTLPIELSLIMPKSNQPATANETSPFYVALKQALSLRGTKIAGVCPPDDHVARRVLHDYGAMFIAGDKVAPPPACVFSNEEQVSRFLPALDHWREAGRLTQSQTEALRSLPIPEQVRAVLELEKEGIFFSKDFSKSVLYSIAAPGTSQHIAMLAFDANEFQDRRVREILAQHGWFQTVLSDLPHFTFLGLAEAELPDRGLKKTEVYEQTFWIPDVG